MRREAHRTQKEILTERDIFGESEDFLIFLQIMQDHAQRLEHLSFMVDWMADTRSQLRQVLSSNTSARKKT